jgi:hypothetical protein
LGDIVLIRATLVRAIFFSIAFFGILAPYRGLAEDGNQLPTKANNANTALGGDRLDLHNVPKFSEAFNQALFLLVG